MGNRTSKSDSATGSESYTFDNANRLMGRNVGGGTNSVYTNDTNGNTLTGGGRTNTWDSQNRLVSCVKSGTPNVTSSFVYGCDGIRRQETTNAGGTSSTTDFVTDANLFIREVNHANSATLATYLVGLRGPEYKRNDVNGTVRWYVFDGLGSVLGEVDPNGFVSGSRKHDVYGLTRSGTGTVTSKHGFVGNLGHASEDETGLVYMQARYYDPATGRFVSQDPGLKGGNWFAYCSNNPINRIDADGKEDESYEMHMVRGAFFIVVGMMLLGFSGLSIIAGLGMIGFDPFWAIAVGSEIGQAGQNILKIICGNKSGWTGLAGNVEGLQSLSKFSRGATAIMGYLLVTLGMLEGVDAAFEAGK